MLAALATPPLLLFLLLPLVVYRLNLASVTASKWLIASAGLAATAAATALLALPPLLRPAWRSRWIASGWAAAAVIAALVIFPNRTGELTGMKPETADSLIPVLKIVLLGAVVAFVAWRRPLGLARAGPGILLGAAAVCLWVLAGPDSGSDRQRRRLDTGREYFTALGSRRNVLVVVLDGFTGYRMVEVLQERPDLRAGLNGFTLYPRAIAPALNTSVGVGAILSGDLKWSFSADDEVQRNAQNVRRSFLADAQRLGFRVSFQSPLKQPPGSVPVAGETEFIRRPGTMERLREYADFLADSLPRILPMALCPADRPGVKTGLRERRARARQAAFRAFAGGLHVGPHPDRVIFFHSWLSHPPYLLDQEGRIHPDHEDRFGSSIHAARELVGLFRRLRELDRYDPALLIVAADHGLMAVRDPGMGGAFPPGRTLDRAYNPLLMVKPPHARRPLRISSMTVWLGDVNATVRDYLGVPGIGPRRVANRSLLQAEVPGRRLSVPLFGKPPGVGFHSGLRRWWRVRVSGTFADYATTPAKGSD